MKAMTAPVCIACSSGDSKIFWSDQSRTVRHCRTCDLLFVFPQPDGATLHNQFQADYFSHNGSAGRRLELEFEVWRKPTVTRIARLIRALKPGGTLLDVGCASGEMLEHFREVKWELYGVEPSEMAFARARERFADNPRVHLFNCYLHQVSTEPKSVDVVTVLEALYHMPDPRRELSHIARTLKDDGILAIAVPGYTYQRLRYSGVISYLLYGSRCSLTASHLFYFSKNSMTELLKSHGFRIFDTVQLGSSSYGGKVGKFARQTYLKFSEILGSLTLGQVNLAPHVLYLCKKSN